MYGDNRYRLRVCGDLSKTSNVTAGCFTSWDPQGISACAIDDQNQSRTLGYWNNSAPASQVSWGYMDDSNSALGVFYMMEGGFCRSQGYFRSWVQLLCAPWQSDLSVDVSRTESDCLTIFTLSTPLASVFAVGAGTCSFAQSINDAMRGKDGTQKALFRLLTILLFLHVYRCCVCRDPVAPSRCPPLPCLLL